MKRTTLARSAWLLAAGTAVMYGCGWDGPAGVQVAVRVPATSDVERGAVDVPLEAPPNDGTADVGEPAGSSVPATTRDLSRITLPPGGRRPLPAELPATVAVVGDSLTLAAAHEIQSALSALGIEVIAIDGAENRRMAHGDDPVPGVDSIAAIADRATPALWVIALGTNDVGAQAAPDRFAGDVTRLLDEIPATNPVVWVDLFIRDRRQQVQTANATLRDVVGRRPGSIVADWSSHGDDDGLITGDGVHLTAAGRRVFAAAIVDAVLTLAD